MQTASTEQWSKPLVPDWLNRAAAEAWREAQRTAVLLPLLALHPAQLAIKRNAARFNAIRCGRRFGKDVLLQDVLIEPALHGQPVGWFAPTYKDTADNWRDLIFRLASVIKASNKTEKRIDLTSGGWIEMWSLEDPDSGRGRKYKRIVVNEASKVRELQYSWEYVIRATLTDLAGDAFFGGTPKGLNYFYRLCRQHETHPDWRAFHFTTYDNPFIPRAELDALRAELPDRVFRQEIMAEFVEDGAYFQNVGACATIAEPDTPEQHAGHVIVGGVDWAKKDDYTVLTLGCQNCNRVVDWQWFNEIDYHLQRARFLALHERWGVLYWLVESNSIGEPNIEELQYADLPIEGFDMTPTSKPPLITSIRRRINSS